MATEIKGHTCRCGTFHPAPFGFGAMMIGVDRSVSGKDYSIGVVIRRVPNGDGTSTMVVERTFQLSPR